MALTLINRTARRVGVAMTATEAEFFYPDTGYRALSTGTHPAQIKVPKGVWTLTVTGDALRSVWYQKTRSTGAATGGRYQVTRYFDGDEIILVNATGPGTCTMVLEEAPPPRVIAFWRVWGWDSGAKENQPAQRLRRRLVCADHFRDRVPYSDQFSTQGTAGAAGAVQAETHPDIFQQIRQRRRTPLGCCGLLPRRLPGQCVPDHELASRLIPAGGEGRGA